MTYHKCGCTTQFGVYMEECSQIRAMRSEWWAAMNHGSPWRAEAIKAEMDEHKEVY